MTARTASVLARHRLVVGAVALLAAAVAPVHAAVAAVPAPPRDETLYTSGVATAGPASFNPLDPARAYTGTQGLIYEPLFLFDPVHGTFIPWLATSGSWVSPTTYRLRVRNDVDWVGGDGDVAGTLTGADVAYSINLAATDKADPYNLDAATVAGATASDDTVTVKFKAPAGYAPWQEFLWHAPIVPQSVWSRLAPASRLDGANPAPVGSGPMLLYSTGRGGACYRDNPRWWGTPQLRLAFRFKFLCAVVSGPSGTELSDLLDGRTDWSNQLLRGIPNLAAGRSGGYDIKTYYPGAPFMLPSSTAWLQMDTARAPMDNVNFRRAVAYALDPSKIISAVYTGAVTAANPTGLLPLLRPYLDKDALGRYGFFPSTSLAKRFLAKSGYRGQRLTLEVPVGWTDQVNAAAMISQQLASVGVHVSTVAKPLPSQGQDVADGDYDMVIASGPPPSDTPWSYFDAVYHLPPGPGAGLDPERYLDPAAWALVQQAAATPSSEQTALAGLYGQLEVDFLQALPEIPLWYNGAWFQASTSHWLGYPSSTEPGDQYTPVMWPGWLGSMTTVLALAQLKAS